MKCRLLIDLKAVRGVLWMAALCGLFLTGCDPDVAGGSGSEAGETLSVVLVDFKGDVVTNGHVRVYRESESDPFTYAPIDSATGEGNITFRLAYSEYPYTLEFYDNTSRKVGVVKTQVHTKNSPLKLDTVLISLVGEVGGTVSSASGTPRLVRLLGAPYESAVNNGSYLLEDVAPGAYPVVVLVDVGGVSEWVFSHEMDVLPGITQTQNLQVRPGEIILEDFNDGDTRYQLASILGEGAWSLWDDDSLGGVSVWNPDVSTEAYFQQGLVTNQAYQGLSFYGTYTLGTESLEHYEPFVAIGLPFGAAYDLSAMDTLAFYGKGDGLMWVEFFSVSNDSVYEVKVPFRMTAGWQEYRVPAESFGIYYQGVRVSGLAWEDVSDSITELVFFPASGSEFWLDNIRMVGVSLQDLVYQNSQYIYP